MRAESNAPSNVGSSTAILPITCCVHSWKASMGADFKPFSTAPPLSPNIPNLLVKTTVGKFNQKVLEAAPTASLSDISFS